MIKTLVAYTAEVDDIETAVQSIQAQLAGQILTHSVGIIACHAEFLTSGAAQAVCAALPFDVVGATTIAQAVNQECGVFLLSVTVLTSDEAVFVTKLTDPLLPEPCAAIERAYQEAAASQTGAPSLILPYAPFMVENSADEYVETLTRASGGIPCFGTIAVDDTLTFELSQLVFNGQAYRDRMGMILVYDDIRPRFLLATISPEKMISKEALVTKSNRHIVQEVNGRPVREYFADLGLLDAAAEQYAMVSLPFMLDYNDGTPKISKVFVRQTEEGYALCAGLMPEGSTLRIGMFDKEDILLTSGQAMDQAQAELENASGMLIYSCIARSLSLGANSMVEMEMVQEKTGGRVPFMMAYSGGEICPTQVSEGQAINRFHNNTFVACVF